MVDRIAFYLFGIPVYWYGVMISLGMLLGTLVALRRTTQYGIDEDQLLSFLLVTVPAAIVGARMVFVFANWETMAGDWPAIINLRQGGLSIHGAILGAIIAGAIYTWVKKIDFWTLADVCVPGLILGQAIGRWGNYFNQEAYGEPTDLPWALYIKGQMVHPTFLYESIWCFIIFLILIFVDNNRKFEGQTFLLYGMLYSFGRFFIEGLRIDSLMIGPIKQAQLLSASVFIIFLIAYILMIRRKKKYGKRIFY